MNRAIPDDRKCYFEDELHLQLFSKYSMDNCWIECLMNITRKVNDNWCYPWNMPAPTESQMCSPLQQAKFLASLNHIDMSKVMGSEACHPDCSGTVYTTKVTSAPFRKCGTANMELSRLCSTAGVGGTGSGKADDLSILSHFKSS